MVETESAGIVLTTPRHEIPSLGIGAGVQPVATQRRSIVLEVGEARELATSGAVLAVDLTSYFLLVGHRLVLIRPRNVEQVDRLRSPPSFR